MKELLLNKIKLIDLFAENAFCYISINLNYIMFGIICIPALYIIFYNVIELLNNFF